MDGPENGNFPLLYVVKMSLRRWLTNFSSSNPILMKKKSNLKLYNQIFTYLAGWSPSLSCHTFEFDPQKDLQESRGNPRGSG